MLTDFLTRFGWFTITGNGLHKAFWLARRRAPFRLSYRSMPWPVLQGALGSGATWEDLEIEDGAIFSHALGLDSRQFPFLAGPAFGQLRAATRLGWTFQPVEGAILARRPGLTLRIETEEEANILHEIFVEDCYGLALPKQWRVLDIGGNAGFAALSLAGRPEVQEVLSFEPFAPTVDAYLRNLALNPALKSKVTLRPLALSNHDSTTTVAYVSELRGSMSLNGLGGWRPASKCNPIPVTLTIRRASDELRPWLEQSDLPVFAKIDCEGAEYQILPDLAAAGLLTKIQAMIIEWHGEGMRELVKVLTGAGYSVQGVPPPSDRRPLGLLLAHRVLE